MTGILTRSRHSNGAWIRHGWRLRTTKHGVLESRPGSGRPKEAIYYDPDAKADFGVILSALAMPAIGLAFCAAVINA